MLQQMLENMLLQTMYVHIANNTQMIQYFDWSNWRALWRYVISYHFSNQTSFQMVRQTSITSII